MKFLLRESDYGRALKAMTAMVQKLYPGFDAGRDFCLWLVPEFFDNTPSYRYFHPDVTLTDHSEQPVSPCPFLSNGFYRLRFYRIFQIMRNGKAASLRKKGN